MSIKKLIKEYASKYNGDVAVVQPDKINQLLEEINKKWCITEVHISKHPNCIYINLRLGVDFHDRIAFYIKGKFNLFSKYFDECSVYLYIHENNMADLTNNLTLYGGTIKIFGCDPFTEIYLSQPKKIYYIEYKMETTLEILDKYNIDRVIVPYCMSQGIPPERTYYNAIPANKLKLGYVADSIIYNPSLEILFPEMTITNTLSNSFGDYKFKKIILDCVTQRNINILGNVNVQTLILRSDTKRYYDLDPILKNTNIKCLGLGYLQLRKSLFDLYVENEHILILTSCNDFVGSKESWDNYNKLKKKRLKQFLLKYEANKENVRQNIEKIL